MNLKLNDPSRQYHKWRQLNVNDIVIDVFYLNLTVKWFCIIYFIYRLYVVYPYF